MQTFVCAARAVAMVIGITAAASLLDRLIANSGLQQFILLHQFDLPGSLFLASVLDNFTYGAAVLLMGWMVARTYWHQLFPANLRWKVLALSLVAGMLFAMFLNHPVHVLLFDSFFGRAMVNGGQTTDSVIGGIFSGFSQTRSLFSMSTFATMFLTPFIEELTDRGILFKEAESMRPWQLALLSCLVFCLAHYAVGGMAKVLAVLPVAILFVATRLLSGSFIYSAAAHAGVNIAALLKLQVW